MKSGLKRLLAIALIVAAQSAGANVIGDDDRRVLSSNINVVRFSSKEQEQAMQCMGAIRCPSDDGGFRQQSAGAICPPGKRDSAGKCAADRIATVGHMFVNKLRAQYSLGMSYCTFSNYAGHTSKLVMSDVRIFDLRDVNNNPHSNMRSDKVVIRLEKQITGCNPYDLSSSAEPPEPGTELIAVTHVQADQPLSLDDREPLAYLCSVTKMFPSRTYWAGAFYSDCDVNGIGSGGFALIRDGFNQLVVAGLFVRSGGQAKNGQPYDEDNDSFTVSVGVNADFVEIAANPGRKPAGRGPLR